MIVALLKNETEASQRLFSTHHSRVQIGICFLNRGRRRRRGRRQLFSTNLFIGNNLNTVAMASAGGWPCSSFSITE
ncbi:hypothetical protein T12_11758 [Trichinella patagoniensis]|uniref:Uncharacterized protein n=1 Tax=Trichinella patagoniensis TaxID=990121 RepID=A0A0V0ZWP0_9BILA|nr:hypothetical protein T12_11758 [Trichinella patagoniensis]